MRRLCNNDSLREALFSNIFLSFFYFNDLSDEFFFFYRTGDRGEQTSDQRHRKSTPSRVQSII